MLILLTRVHFRFLSFIILLQIIIENVSIIAYYYNTSTLINITKEIVLCNLQVSVVNSYEVEYEYLSWKQTFHSTSAFLNVYSACLLVAEPIRP
jgi:hypothetical protein